MAPHPTVAYSIFPAMLVIFTLQKQSIKQKQKRQCRENKRSLCWNQCLTVKKGFPLPAPQGKFWDITTFKWRFLASETWFNSLCLHTIHYSKTLFSAQWPFVLSALSLLLLFYTLFFLEGGKRPMYLGKLFVWLLGGGAIGYRGC